MTIVSHVRHRLRRLARSRATQERGAVLVMVALLLVALAGTVSLVTDVGMLSVTRRHLQNAADAGALAGVQALPAAPATARADAVAWTGRNGVGVQAGDTAAASVARTFTANDTVTVQVSRTVPFGFARVFRLISADVRVDATAVISPAGAVRSANGVGVLPWAVNNDAFIAYGTLVGLQPANGDNQAGQFNFVSITPPGGRQSYADAMVHGVTEPICVGVNYPTNTFDGSRVSSATAGALNARINARPAETWDDFGKGSPRVVVIPIINGNVPNAPEPVMVETFRAFFIERVDSDTKSIWGRFVPLTVPVGDLPAPGGHVPDLGVHVAKLVR